MLYYVILHYTYYIYIYVFYICIHSIPGIPYEIPIYVLYQLFILMIICLMQIKYGTISVDQELGPFFYAGTTWTNGGVLPWPLVMTSSLEWKITHRNS